MNERYSEYIDKIKELEDEIWELKGVITEKEIDNGNLQARIKKLEAAMEKTVKLADEYGDCEAYFEDSIKIAKAALGKGE